MHFLKSYLNLFPQNCDDLSDQYGERFHQDICRVKQRYKEKWSIGMLADYCWIVKKDALKQSIIDRLKGDAVKGTNLLQ